MNNSATSGGGDSASSAAAPPRSFKERLQAAEAKATALKAAAAALAAEAELAELRAQAEGGGASSASAAVSSAPPVVAGAGGAKSVSGGKRTRTDVEKDVEGRELVAGDIQFSTKADITSTIKAIFNGLNVRPNSTIFGTSYKSPIKMIPTLGPEVDTKGFLVTYTTTEPYNNIIVSNLAEDTIGEEGMAKLISNIKALGVEVYKIVVGENSRPTAVSQGGGYRHKRSGSRKTRSASRKRSSRKGRKTRSRN